MTMHPDPHPPRGIPLHRVTVFDEAEAERIAAHIHATTFYSVLHEDAGRLSEGMGAATWAAGALFVGFAALIVWVFLW